MIAIIIHVAMRRITTGGGGGGGPTYPFISGDTINGGTASSRPTDLINAQSASTRPADLANGVYA